MPKPQKIPGHYCYVCGQRKANEKFSGKGHAAHVCKACSKLPAHEQQEAMTVNRIYSMAFRYISPAEKDWLKRRMTDKRPEVKAIAKDVYFSKFKSGTQRKGAL